jgi:hypothetical protein
MSGIGKMAKRDLGQKWIDLGAADLVDELSAT